MHRELGSLEISVLSVNSSKMPQIRELLPEPSYCTVRVTVPVCVIAPDVPVTVIV